MKSEAELEIDRLMEERNRLEAKLQIIVQKLRLTVIKNSVLNVNAHSTTNGR